MLELFLNFVSNTIPMGSVLLQYHPTPRKNTTVCIIYGKFFRLANPLMFL